MSKRPTKVLLEDILTAIRKIGQYVGGLSREQFLTKSLTIDAVVRNLEIIGEAANRLPLPFKTAHADVAWPQIVGLRHRIVHDYFDVDLEIVWQILKNDLPNLESQIARLRSSAEGES